MARGVRWPLSPGPEGGYELTDTADETTRQEIVIGLTSDLSSHEWAPGTGRDCPPLAYASGPDGGRGVVLRRASTVFRFLEDAHRARLDGPPDIVQSGAGWRTRVRYRSIERGDEPAEIEV